MTASPSPISPPPAWWRALFNRRMLLCVFTGFSSGLPLFFMLSLLPAWFRSEGVDIKTIGTFALTQMPFTLKFLWAPLMDSVTLPFLGRRRGWMLVTQLALLATLAAHALFSPAADLYALVLLSFLTAFFGASQDIVVDAYRREILPDAELGLGNSIHIAAYRISAFIPGALSLILADHMDWSSVFLITACFMLPGVYMTLALADEPLLDARAPRTLHDTFVEPFREFFRRQGLRPALTLLAFIFLYKLGDSMATALATPFYLDMGFSKSDIGLIAKNASLWPMLLSGIVGGAVMVKTGINRALWLFGVVQAITILGFAWLAHIGPFPTGHIGAWQRTALALVIGGEAIGVGLGTAAFVAFIARTTHPAYTATQFALLTSLAAVPRTFINAITGVLIEALGYERFFYLCFLLALPGMALLLCVAPWNNPTPTTTTTEHP